MDATSSKKICLSILFISIGVGIVIPAEVGKVYPYTNIVFTVGIIATAFLFHKEENPKQTYSIYITSIIVLAVAYRLRIFFFPDSMLGMDPDGYAVQITRVMISGDISSITYNNFYSKAPLYILEGVVSGLVTGLSAPIASAVYPILSGIATPLVATVFAKQLRPNSPRTMIVAAAGASVLSFSVRFSYWPIAQTTGVIFVLFVIFLMLIYSQEGGHRWLVLALLTMVGAIYTHKLAAITIAASICGAAALGYLHPSTRNSPAVMRLTRGAVGLVALLTVVQLFFATDFGQKAILRIAIQSSSRSIQEPTAAIDPVTIGGKLFKSSYAGLLAVFSGAVWCGWLWKTVREKGPNRDVLFLGLVAPTAGLSLITPLVGATRSRTIYYSEVLLLVVIVVGLYWVIVESSASSRRTHRYIAVGVVFLLMVAAGLSPNVAPDYESDSRDYLTAEEVEAKEWGYEQVPHEIATDVYYAQETPPSKISGFDSISDIDLEKFNQRPWVYLNNEFRERKFPVIAYRSCIDTLRSPSGVWEITYDPSEILNQDYNRMYDSGCVSYFSQIG